MFGVKMCKIIIMQHTDTSVSVPIGHRDSRMNCCTISMNLILNANAMYINLFFYDLQNCEKARQRKNLVIPQSIV